MSRCISHHGEYGSHTLVNNRCTFCRVWQCPECGGDEPYPLDGDDHECEPARLDDAARVGGLPSAPGLYRARDDDQRHMGEWHTDGWQFHYLNADGNWSDIGWGFPRDGQSLELGVTWVWTNPEMYPLSRDGAS